MKNTIPSGKAKQTHRKPRPVVGFKMIPVQRKISREKGRSGRKISSSEQSRGSNDTKTEDSWSHIGTTYVDRHKDRVGDRRGTHLLLWSNSSSCRNACGVRDGILSHGQTHQSGSLSCSQMGRSSIHSQGRK